MIPKSHPLHRLFRGLTESTFMTELGIGDPSLVGYVADLLASFVPSQMVWRIRDKQGQHTELSAEPASLVHTLSCGRAGHLRLKSNSVYGSRGFLKW